jgi:redox-sensitive bicupin YhaK (pirin superfamily)
LRDAVDDANAAGTDDTISFAAGVTNITLTKEILINNTGTLTINGNGANVLTIDGGAGTNRIFTTYHATVTVTGVTLTGGNGTADEVVSGPGGAIYAYEGTLVLNGVHVTANSAAPNFSGGGVMVFYGTNHQIPFPLIQLLIAPAFSTMAACSP